MTKLILESAEATSFKMKKLLIFLIVIFAVFNCVSYSAPLDDKEVNKQSKSTFGQAFDEIVVESHLTVKRKSNGRQGRAENVTDATGIIKTKREIKLSDIDKTKTSRPQQLKLKTPLEPKQFQASAASAQAQAFNSFSPISNFGASAAGSQTQNFGVGPNGFTGNAGFSGNQKYHFNGYTVDISFGSNLPNPKISVNGPGRKRQIHN